MKLHTYSMEFYMTSNRLHYPNIAVQCADLGRPIKHVFCYKSRAIINIIT